MEGKKKTGIKFKLSFIMKYRLAILGACLMVACMAVYINMNPSVEAISKYGSRGDEVRQIQTKLKNWGYLTGTVDGIYGTNTMNAVKAFQSKNGLTADGVAGPKTLEKMGIVSAVPASTGGGGYNQTDIDLLARIINAEARGEPYEGQVAVGGVVLNRVKHPSFPSTIAGVIYQPGAFTAVTDGQINAAMVSTSYQAARDAMNAWDPSNGAIYYYNPSKTSNQWMLSRPVLKVIGRHKFCK